MLIMQRRVGESILLGDDVEIRILNLGRNRVRIGITAPQAVTVRARVMDMIREENRAAAQFSGNAPALLARLLQRGPDEKKAKNAGETVR